MMLSHPKELVKVTVPLGLDSENVVPPMVRVSSPQNDSCTRLEVTGFMVRSTFMILSHPEDVNRLTTPEGLFKSKTVLPTVIDSPSHMVSTMSTE